MGFFLNIAELVKVETINYSTKLHAPLIILSSLLQRALHPEYFFYLYIIRRWLSHVESVLSRREFPAAPNARRKLAYTCNSGISRCLPRGRSILLRSSRVHDLPGPLNTRDSGFRGGGAPWGTLEMPDETLQLGSRSEQLCQTPKWNVAMLSWISAR